MANQYSTYVPVDAVDWGTAIGGLYKTVNDIGESRKAEKDQLDKLMGDAILDINKTESLKTQSLQDYILEGANNGREVLKSANQRLKAGELNPKEYKAIVNNVTTYWSTMASSMKNFDSTNQEMLKRLSPGEDGTLPQGSEYEQYLAEIHAGLGDIRNSKFIFNPNSGEGYMMKIDPQTGTPSKIISSMVPANPTNLIDNRVDFDKIVTDATKGWKQAYTNEDGSITIKDPTQNPFVANSIVALTTSLSNSPRNSGQILARYNGYQFYESEQQKNNIIQSEISKENESRQIQGKKPMTESEIENFTNNFAETLIYSSLDENQTYQPRLTEDQQKMAKTIITDLIKSKLPISKTLDEPRRSSSGSGSGSGNKMAVDKKALASAEDVRSILSGENALQNINERYKSKGIRLTWDKSKKKFIVFKFDANAPNRDSSTGKGAYIPTGEELNWDATEFYKLEGFGGPTRAKWDEAVETLRGE
jgi:molecular chaperone GrpE (heat shock protein)